MDGDLATRWAMAAGQTTGWIDVDLGKPMEVSRAVIQEVSYPNVTKFALEVRQADGTWQSIAAGETIGAKKELTFAPATARNFRVNILDGKSNASFEEFQLFAK